MRRRLTYNPPGMRPLKVSRTRSHDQVSSESGGGGYISPSTRRLVWRRDEGRCHHCGSTEELHFDHIVPRSLGGSGTAANVELLCRRCNLAKGAAITIPHD